MTVVRWRAIALLGMNQKNRPVPVCRVSLNRPVIKIQIKRTGGLQSRHWRPQALDNYPTVGGRYPISIVQSTGNPVDCRFLNDD